MFVEWMRLVFKAHRLLYHSTLGLRVIEKKKKDKKSMEMEMAGKYARKRERWRERERGRGKNIERTRETKVKNPHKVTFSRDFGGTLSDILSVEFEGFAHPQF